MEQALYIPSFGSGPAIQACDVRECSPVARLLRPALSVAGRRYGSRSQDAGGSKVRSVLPAAGGAAAFAASVAIVVGRRRRQASRRRTAVQAVTTQPPAKAPPADADDGAAAADEQEGDTQSRAPVPGGRADQMTIAATGGEWPVRPDVKRKGAEDRAETYQQLKKVFPQMTDWTSGPPAAPATSAAAKKPSRQEEPDDGERWGVDDEGGPGDDDDFESAAADDSFDEDGWPIQDDDGGDSQVVAIKPYGALRKVLPEDQIREMRLARREAERNRPIEGADVPLDGAGREMPDVPDPIKGSTYERWRALREAAEEDWKQYEEAEMARIDGSQYALASVTDREAWTKGDLEETNIKAIQRVKTSRLKKPVGDTILPGTPVPDGYIEIMERPEPMEGQPDGEACNGIVARELGISTEEASALIKLGAVWVWEKYWANGWERMVKNEAIAWHQQLRVFPNPERYRTCYMEDWRERVKTVDSDFVVVDKPPLLPCFAKVSNGRESLGQCMREALHVRKWGGYNAEISDDFEPCNELDDEATGLVALSRHEKAKTFFTEQVEQRKVVFEYVALCEGVPEEGIYRHFFEVDKAVCGKAMPELYDDIPLEAIKVRSDFLEWECAEMEVVTTAELPGGCSAVRIRTHCEGWTQRIRDQLARLGCPVLNDDAKTVVAKSKGPAEMTPLGGLLSEEGSSSSSSSSSSSALSTRDLAGALDEEVQTSSYGHKIELLPHARDSAKEGKSQKHKKKVPVAFHLARLEFGGRVVTCAPPAYWPPGAAAAVAVKLTVQDIRTQVQAFLITQGGYARFGQVGGKFSVKVEWLEDHFPIDRAAGVVFASEDAKAEWEGGVRVKQGKKAWQPRHVGMKRKKFKDEMFKIREKYIAPQNRGSQKTPSFKQIKRGKVKPYKV
eukprot:TRINITY_DN5843_c0_g1_i1.p1 TRINITY_DN5843_c0_g1~~TRINITY_DN5843_c0_g1_i1.p1  ORF type:complete len:902 (-),score=258.95 TRINITY_DN5843_c0_g1_i1:116-2821(-)